MTLSRRILCQPWLWRKSSYMLQMYYTHFHYHLQVYCWEHILLPSLLILVNVFSSTWMICSSGTGGVCRDKLIHWNSNLPWITGYTELSNSQYLIYSLKDTAFSVWYFFPTVGFESHYFSVCLTYSSSKFFNGINKLQVSSELRTLVRESQKPKDHIVQPCLAKFFK